MTTQDFKDRGFRISNRVMLRSMFNAGNVHNRFRCYHQSRHLKLCTKKDNKKSHTGWWAALRRYKACTVLKKCAKLTTGNKHSHLVHKFGFF